MADTHGSDEEEWVGFDLDGTLAKYDGWKGVDHIGDPVPSMVLMARLLHWLGKKVKVLTARVAPREDGEGGDKARKYVEDWCRENLGFVPEITHVKDASMAALFDDRAIAVERNTGKVLGGWSGFLPRASDRAKRIVGERGYWKGRLIKVIKRRNPDLSESDVLSIANGRMSEREAYEKRAGIEFGDGSYDDVRKIYESLSDAEKNFVTPGRTVYKDVPKFLTGRTVAYDGGEPVGFSDVYGYSRNGKLRASPSLCLAVSDAARGNGLASSMTKDVMRKVIERAREIRREKGDAADRVRRFVWMALNENEASARAALKTGFNERKSDEPGSRKFTMSRTDAERMVN